MRRIDFTGLPWVEVAEGIRCKTVSPDGFQIRVVEFAEGFSEATWCTKAHVGYVLAGCLEVRFEDRVEMLSGGDALAIPAGEPHQARVIEGPARLFLVED